MGQVLSGLGQQGGYGQRRSGTRQVGGGSPYGGIYGPNGDIPGYYLGGSGPGNGGNSGSGSSTGWSDPLGGLHYGSMMPNPQKGGVVSQGGASAWNDKSPDPSGSIDKGGPFEGASDLIGSEKRMGERAMGGAVEATPPDLGGMTIQNPMRKRRGGMQYTPEQQRY